MTKRKVVFSGASGNGMSPLEQILVKKGYEVYGTDMAFDQGLDHHNRQALEAAGIKIIPQDGSGITTDVECVYYSTALNENNPDIKAANALNIPLVKRYDLLAEIFSSYAKGIAVGGTAGKTSTTAMIGYILDRLGQKPCMINGGMLCNYENNVGLPNYIYNENDICVIEADESNGSIQKYYPYIGIVNNISHDHTSMEKLIEYFSNFASHVQYGLIVNYDCPLARNLKSAKKTFTFSTKDSKADIFAYNIKASNHGIDYSIDGKSFRLNLLGRFNVSNALAAISACILLGIDKFDAAKALENFTGTNRRLEIAGTSKDILFVDDFAHNPSKVSASLSALKDYPGRVIAMYQPHTPFSAVNTGDEMATEIVKILGDDDIMIFQEIYELTPNDVGITSNNIVNKIKELGHKNALFLPHKEDTRQFILQNARAGDSVIIMGAHDNSLPDFCRQLLNEI